MLSGKPFFFAENIAGGVQNLDAAVKWYSTKLGVCRNFLRSDASEVFLAFLNG
jgi:hypothetical protein